MTGQGSTAGGRATPSRQRDSWRGPVTGALRKWAARPDLLADPEQQDDGQVWTSRADVLGRQPRHGDEVIAAWGDVTWQAIVSGESDETGELWLTPKTDALVIPQVANAHSVHDLAQRLIETLHLSPEPERAFEIRARVAEALMPLMADFQGLVDTFEDEVRADRETARQILRALRSGTPSKRVRRLLDGPVGEDLVRLARVPRRPIGR